MKEKLIQRFYDVFSAEGSVDVYFAPGRVNLIGEHTDYNGGHVFPCALTIGTYAAVRKREDHKIRFYSMNFEQLGILESSLDELINKKENDWTNYPLGVCWAIKEKGFSIPCGFDILYFGNIPNGSGLSSSASIEVLTAYVLREMFSFDISLIEIAKLCQYSENKFNGVNCGIMDQFAIAMGMENKAIFLDTADLSYEYADILLEDAKIVIMNTNKKRGLGDSKYNQRRSECEAALEQIKSVIPVSSLGELTEEQFEANQNAITDEIQRKRAKHAVYENQRTIKAVEALKNKDIELFGKLMIDSHTSLKYDYEVTGTELDTLVEEALKIEGVIGARMTGAGFGGCAVSIVKEQVIDSFIENVGKAYKEKIGYEADFYIVSVGGGPVKL
ncbi:galactokinase [Anaeromicropila populeti]|uniref:Galactokinase n=1 Tax=Anaeromicropila populeti TaxID=37658 RepID=A0A1I6KKU3_9FIRM|nr:galactokinase [Anaeromicropila populeti]SFR91500.1 galactokinase [Anaeromicropila populeti]